MTKMICTVLISNPTKIKSRIRFQSCYLFPPPQVLASPSLVHDITSIPYFLLLIGHSMRAPQTLHVSSNQKTSRLCTLPENIVLQLAAFVFRLLLTKNAAFLLLPSISPSFLLDSSSHPRYYFRFSAIIFFNWIWNW